MFWIDGNLSTFCIAKKIQEDIGCDIHAIFNVTNKPKKFIQNQKLVDFKSFSFYHDNVTDLNSEPDLNYLKQKEEEQIKCILIQHQMAQFLKQILLDQSQISKQIL